MTGEDPEVVAARLALDDAFDQLRKIEIARTGVTPRPPICSFCGKGTNEVARMLAGFHGANICNECVVVAHESIAGAPSSLPPRS